MIGASKYDVEEILTYLRGQVEHLVLVDADKALRELGNDKVLNILLLGAAADTGELGIDKESIREAIRQRLPEKLHELNFRALEYV